jgi:radical SAM superfamily enzyme YgiQ (UPF0313 family)
MRLLLVWPKARTDPEWGGDLGAIAEPLALEYLSAGARADGHEVRVLDLRLHPAALVDTLRAYAPDVVGVTAFSMHVRAALAVCATVKDECPSCVTVAGGHHATFLPEDFFEPQIDAVVSGEGVGPLREILRRLQAGDDLLGIPGTAARVGACFEAGPPQDVFDVNALPAPDRAVTADDRHAYFIDWMRPVALLRTTVGCPYRCSFCSLWQLMGGRYLLRDIDAVVEELGSIEEDYVFLVDDEAFIHGKRMAALAEAIERSGIRKRLFAYCRIDTLLRNRAVIEAWQRIGLERLFIGIDAISPKDLDEYHKKLSVQAIEDGLRTARDIGVEVLAQFVVNTDYAPRDFERLARFVDHHKIRYPSFTVLTPLPGTDLLKDFDSVVVRQPNGRPDWDYFDTQNAVTATALGAAEFRVAYRDLFRRYMGSYGEHFRHHTRLAELAGTGTAG